MLQNNIELDLKTKLIESGTTQTEVAEKVGVSLAYVNRITKGREQIVSIPCLCEPHHQGPGADRE